MVAVARNRQLAAALGALDRAHQVGDARRLQQVVGRAALQALHRVFRVAVSGEHHHRGVGMALQDLVEQPDAIVNGHLQIGEDRRHFARSAQELESLFGGSGCSHGVTFLAQHRGDHVADGGVVVDDEHRRLLIARRLLVVVVCLHGTPRSSRALERLDGEREVQAEHLA